VPDVEPGCVLALLHLQAPLAGVGVTRPHQSPQHLQHTKASMKKNTFFKNRWYCRNVDNVDTNLIVDSHHLDFRVQPDPVLYATAMVL
jgi:hypothetical protein